MRAERTHDLGRLLQVCVRYDASLSAWREDSDYLTDYAVDVR